MTKKPEEKPEEIAANNRAMIMRKAWANRNRICGEARSLLTQLETWLAEHEKSLKQREMGCARLLDDPRRVFQNGGTAAIKTDPVTLATQLISGKKTLAEIVADEQQLLAPFYRRLQFGEGHEDDVTIFREWDRERASVLVLRAAIALQKTTVLKLTESSMREFSSGIAELRAPMARDFLALVAELKRVLAPDRSLAEELDPGEVSYLKPAPFPHRILSSEAIAWLLDAVSAGIIQPAELNDLQ
jgi:hypothetical protein